MNKVMFAFLKFGFFLNIARDAVVSDKMTDITMKSVTVNNITYPIINGKLNLSRKGLKAFPKKILKQHELTELNLSENNIKEIPSKISELTNLKILNLNSNYKLTHLPLKIQSLENIEKLYLYNCNISPTTLDETLGKIDLIKIFGEKVVFHNIYHHDDRNNEYCIFQRVMNQPIHWNWTQLNLIRLPEYPQNNLLSKCRMIEIIEKAFTSKIFKVHTPKRLFHENVKEVSKKINDKTATRGYQFNLNDFTKLPRSLKTLNKYKEVKLIEHDSDATLLIKYIEKLYDPKNENPQHAMFGNHVPVTLGMMSNILECLELSIDFHRIGTLLYVIDDIKEIVKRTRQLDEYDSKIDIDEQITDMTKLEIFIKNKIADIKSGIFQIAIQHGILIGHIPSCGLWKQKFLDVTRFDFDYEAENPLIFPPCFDKDEFSIRTKAMQIFFDFFNPKYVIKLLAVQINTNEEIKEWLINVITKDTKLNHLEKSNMIINTVATHRLLGNFNKTVTQEAVEYILVKMDILIKNKN